MLPDTLIAFLPFFASSALVYKLNFAPANFSNATSPVPVPAFFFKISSGYVGVFASLGVVFVVYILYSYVFKEPTYLETEEAIAQLNKEEEERQIRLNRFNRNFERIDRAEPAQETKQEPDIEQKFEKLKTLKEKGFITEEEFEERKKKLLDSEL